MKNIVNVFNTVCVSSLHLYAHLRWWLDVPLCQSVSLATLIIPPVIRQRWVFQHSASPSTSPTSAVWLWLWPLLLAFLKEVFQMWKTCTGIDRHREWSIFEICDCDCDWESTLRNSGQAHKFSVFLSIYRRVWVLIVPVVCWLATRQARPLLGPLQLVPYSILDFCSLSRVACSTTVIHLQTGINLSHYLCCTSSQYADDGCHGSQTICPLTDWELSMFRALHPCHFPDVWCCLAWQPLIPPPSVLYFSNTGLWVSDNQRPRLWPT